MYKIIYSEQAGIDLESIFSYITENVSSDIAENYLFRMKKAIHRLELFPLLGYASTHKDFSNFRILIFEEYYIYYVACSHMIKIYYIRHSKRDIII